MPHSRAARPAAARSPLRRPPDRPPRRVRCGAAALLALALGGCAHAPLPAPVHAALAQAQIGPEHLAVWVGPAGQSGAPRWTHRADAMVNPASLMKLVTTSAALDLLGPSHTWTTAVYHGGAVLEGRLDGPLYLQGRGDPQLVTERLWLLLSRVQAEGVHDIQGDIVLDRSAFGPPDEAPGDFDGEPLRPYNVQPDALLVNYKSVTLTLRPDAARGVALVSHAPALAGMVVPASVPLLDGACDDWRRLLGADFSDPLQVRLAGAYPVACGEQTWTFAYADPAAYNARAVAAAWQALGGRLTGQVREGTVPADLAPAFEFASRPLADVVRDINRFSNNVMAQQVFLTLGLTQRGSGTPEAARDAVAAQVRARAGCRDGDLLLDNGSGRSRSQRITARCLARVLDAAWRSPWMPELLASLPVAGAHTARRARSAAGRAHVKTGSLRDVAALAGVVHGHDGSRHVVVAVINHPAANGAPARAVLDAVLGWALDGTASGPAPD
jgi:D-alanyl-D-alanine carboxypeptidase/D-alanyl-D-alanine-endopeptidase (penicillin-binding protein 4)